MEYQNKIINRQETLRAQYPKIIFDSFDWIDNPTSTQLFIDDLSDRSRYDLSPMLNMIESLSSNKIRTFSASTLVRTMETLINKEFESTDPSNTVLMFPGEGAETIKSLLSLEFITRFQVLYVQAKRIKDPITSDVVGISLPWSDAEMKAVIAQKNVMIVDDVIDSGRTIQEIKNKLDVGQTWMAASPIIFSPLPYSNRTTASSIEGFDKIIGSLVLEGPQNPVPLNSLSSLVEGGPKTKRLLSRCVSLCPDGAEIKLIMSISQIGYQGGYL